MTAEHIQTSVEDGVMTVTIANEARRNAITTGALDRLNVLADEIAQGAARAVVLTGAGDKAFTSGFDLSELGEFQPENFLKSYFSDVFEKWARLPVPVIGALNGHCMGGGVHVAVMCDALTSVPGARFMIPAARFGIIYIPASIKRITATLGPSQAAKLLYLNQELVAEDLAPSGFIHQITPTPLAAAHQMARQAAGLAPLAVSAMKELVRDAPTQQRIDEMVAVCAYSEDVKEGLAAMREKRSPLFKGR